VIQDAGWGWGPASNGKTLFTGAARSGGWFDGKRCSCRATAALSAVSVASLVKWSQRWRVGGSALAKPMDGRRPLRLNPEHDWLLARIAEKPDLTVRPVMAELAERGTPGSYGAVALLQARGHHV
jgi:transposase